MLKRPKFTNFEEDILRSQMDFEKNMKNNPNYIPLVRCSSGPPKKSLFAKGREKGKQEELALTRTLIPTAVVQKSEESVDIINELNSDSFHLIGDIVVRKYDTNKVVNTVTPLLVKDFPKVSFNRSNVKPQHEKSLFALQMEVNAKESKANKPMGIQKSQTDALIKLMNFNSNDSVVIEESQLAKELHKQNLDYLSKMSFNEICANRDQLLNTLDPSLVTMLQQMRKRKSSNTKVSTIPKSMDSTVVTKKMEIESKITENLFIQHNFPSTNYAFEILEQSFKENWLNFDVIEKDKLEWMQDIRQMSAKLEPGEKFQARFDWNGILLPYNKENYNLYKDDRELYLHGEEPDRPGYTLQELFRLARSNIVQQRGAAFGAIARLLNIYNQGFYDGVIDLPLNKIFFLLRYGFDDQNPLMLEYTSKGLSFLLYNESDECLLDEIFELPVCHWQPTLKVLKNIDPNDSEYKSTDELIKYLQSKSKLATDPSIFQIDVEENPDENQIEINDYALAEKDLIAVLMRTNILRRVYYILHKIRPNNSTVSSCMKILIRIARTSKELSYEIFNNKELILCLFQNFLPDMERMDTTLLEPQFYNYPQHLCLKLFRVMISQSRQIALNFLELKIVDKLENYIFNRDNIKAELIKVQIEALRILRCLLSFHLDNELFKKFLNSICYMLKWHFDHVVYDVGGSSLIRKHASALLAVISTIPAKLEVNYLLGGLLHDCCCSWFYKATSSGIKEFSQASLLTVSLNAIAWVSSECDITTFHDFCDKYLCNFITSDSFTELIHSMMSSSIILRKANDRRFVNPQLPNVGAVVLNQHGPYLIITKNYPFFLLTALWRLLDLQVKQPQPSKLLNSLLNPKIFDTIVNYLRALSIKSNRYMSSNFFANTEIRFIFLLLCLDEFNSNFANTELLQLVYNYLCCLTAEHMTAVEELFKKYIFNTKYIRLDGETLNKWCSVCLEEVYQHSIIVNFEELPLSKPFYEPHLLPKDWPYFRLKIILKNFLQFHDQRIDDTCSDNEAILMTLKFVAELESLNVQLVSATEKLMYLMLCFMSSNPVFLEKDINQLLRNYLLEFYEKYKNYTFNFDEIYQDNCRFENLYMLFVNHFQYTSFGSDLFSSLLLVPLAQKYDNKWRRRIWSEFAGSLFYINCEEKLLMGGLTAYLEPAETEKSLIIDYYRAIKHKCVKVDTLPYKIAKHHVEKYIEVHGNI